MLRWKSDPYLSLLIVIALISRGGRDSYPSGITDIMVYRIILYSLIYAQPGKPGYVYAGTENIYQVIHMIKIGIGFKSYYGLQN
jgi:hypothetical protein